MDAEVAIRIALPIGVGLGALGCGIGLGNAVKGAMEAMGRQPEMHGKLQTTMMIGAAFIEALTIYVIVSKFLM